MRIIKLLGLMFTAVLAIVAASTTSASALLFVTTGASEESFEIKGLNTTSNPAILENSGGTKIECPSILGKGIILNKTDKIDKLLFTYHGCKDSLGQSCLTLGEPSGLITTLELDALLVTTLAGNYAILVLGANSEKLVAHYECGVGSGPFFELKVLVLGSIAGEFKNPKTELETGIKETKIEFTKGAKAGEAGIKCYWTLEGIKEAKLDSVFSGAINETAELNELLVFDLLTTNVFKLEHK